jgi:very-short-patch-repair endonuclease
MVTESPLGRVSRLSAGSLGMFRGFAAVELGVTRKQLAALRADDVIERVLPDTYRMTAVRPSGEQRLRAALLWGGPDAAAASRSAGETYSLEAVHAPMPEIIVPGTRHVRSPHVVVHRLSDFDASMIRERRGLRVTGVEPTLVALGATLDAEAFEIACEDARRRRLTSIPALRAYLARFGRRGLIGTEALRTLLDALDPVYPSRSTLEVKTRRLLVVNGYIDFVREFPLAWNGRTFRFDFCFERRRTILETNGRRWHDDPADYEHDNEKWSVPGRHGYKLILATWDKVTRQPDRLLAELVATLAA